MRRGGPPNLWEINVGEQGEFVTQVCEGFQQGSGLVIALVSLRLRGFRKDTQVHANADHMGRVLVCI